jgi:hypothetical protein
MTVKQFRKKVEIARKYGKANLEDGYTLHYYGPGSYWALRDDKSGNTVDVAYHPEQLEYLYN